MFLFLSESRTVPNAPEIAAQPTMMLILEDLMRRKKKW
jgi:hypothetical protein